MFHSRRINDEINPCSTQNVRSALSLLPRPACSFRRRRSFIFALLLAPRARLILALWPLLKLPPLVHSGEIAFAMPKLSQKNYYHKRKIRAERLRRVGDRLAIGTRTRRVGPRESERKKWPGRNQVKLYYRQKRRTAKQKSIGTFIVSE